MGRVFFFFFLSFSVLFPLFVFIFWKVCFVKELYSLMSFIFFFFVSILSKISKHVGWRNGHV